MKTTTPDHTSRLPVQINVNKCPFVNYGVAQGHFFLPLKMDKTVTQDAHLPSTNLHRSSFFRIRGEIAVSGTASPDDRCTIRGEPNRMTGRRQSKENGRQ